MSEGSVEIKDLVKGVQLILPGYSHLIWARAEILGLFSRPILNSYEADVVKPLTCYF
jgi:hypothetical protein